MFTQRVELSPSVEQRLKVLTKFNIRVAKMLLWANKVGVPPEYLTKNSADYIDIAKDDSMVSFLSIDSNKLKKIQDKWKDGKRQDVKAGRILRKIFNDVVLDKFRIDDHEVEVFTNGWKNLCLAKDEKFEIISGDKIGFYYSNKHYYDKGNVQGTTLWHSCMQGVPKNYFDIYTKNSQVSLVGIFKMDGDWKLAARAIMWSFVDEIKNEDFKVIDRVYYIKNSYYDYYKIMAVGLNAWLKDQRGGGFINPKTGKTEMMSWVFALDRINFSNYPYLDTFNYLDKQRGTISNDRSTASRMVRTANGGGGDEF